MSRSVLAILLCLSMLTICLPIGATAPPTGWNGPEPLSSQVSSFSSPDLYQLDDGRAVMAWGQCNEAVGMNVSHVSFYDPASGWEEPTTVGRGKQDCQSVRCLLQENGSAMVVSVYSLGTGDMTLSVSVYAPEVGWKLDHQLVGKTASIGDVRLAQLPGGSFLLAWTESDGSHSMVRYSTWSWEDGWSELQDLAGDLLDSASLADLDLRPDGTGMALLVENNAGLWTAYASFRSPNGSWTVPSPVTQDNIGGRIVGANTAGSGAVAVYTTNGNRELWAVSWHDGWSAPEQLFSSSTAYSVEHHLDVNQAGQGLLVQRRTADQIGYYAIAFNGGTWGQWERVSPELPYGSSWTSDFVVDVNSAGEGVVAFRGSDIGLGRLDHYANLYSPSSGWQGPERISRALPFGGENVPSSASIDPSGNVLYGFVARSNLISPVSSDRLYVNTYHVEDKTPPRLVVSSPAPMERVNVSSVVVSGTTDPDAKVIVAGIELAVDAGGNFQGRVPVVPGENRLSVTAVDEHGNQATVYFTVFFDDPLQEELAQARHDLGSLKGQGLLYLGLASAAMVVGALSVLLYLRGRKA